MPAGGDPQPVYRVTASSSSSKPASSDFVIQTFDGGDKKRRPVKRGGRSWRLVCWAGLATVLVLADLALLAFGRLPLLADYNSDAAVSIKSAVQPTQPCLAASVAEGPAPAGPAASAGYLFPEAQYWFEIGPLGGTQCGHLLGHLQGYASLQRALQVCLGQPHCTHVEFRSHGGGDVTAQLCSGTAAAGEGAATKAGWQMAVRKGCQGYSRADAGVAILASEGGASCIPTPRPDVCSPGLAAIGLNRACDTCGPAGFCGTLPGAELLQGFNEPLQAHVESILGTYFYRAYNPSLVNHANTTWAVVRVSNYTVCENSASRPAHREEGDMSYIDNHIVLCPLAPRPTGDLAPDTAGCRYIPVNLAPLAEQVPSLDLRSDLHGFEDSRAFVYRGSMYLLSFIYTLDDPAKNNVWYHNSRWFERSATLSSYMAVARLDAGLRVLEEYRVMLCPDLKDQIHKNWMPLITADGSLFMVSHPQPLTIVKPDLEAGTCRVVFRDTASDTRQEYSAVMETSHLHGGSPFASIAPNRFLGIVHRYHDKFLFGRIYIHHLMLIEHTGGDSFKLAWLSEAFRLPDLPNEKGVTEPVNIQFSDGLVLINDTLHISYGIRDCHAMAAKVPNFQARLAGWLEKGMGTQSAVEAAPAASVLPQVMWDNKCGNEEFGLETTRQIMLSWFGNSSVAADAEVFAIGVLQWNWEDSMWDRADAAGKPMREHIVSTNVQGNQLMDVVITSSWLEYTSSVLTKAWIPYVRWRGDINAASAALLHQNASEIWVPISFHKAALERIGIPSEKILVMPYPLTPEDSLCPADLAGGTARPPPVGGARGFMLLYRGTAHWHLGAALLVEAFGQGFTSEDDITLVLHLLSSDDPDQEEALAQQVKALQAKPGAPHIILIRRDLHFGRQAERLVASADAVVLPYLGGTWERNALWPISCGRPVVTTAGGPAADIITEDNGYLVPSAWGPCGPAPLPASGQAAEGTVPGGEAAASLAPPRLADVCLSMDPAALAGMLRRVWGDGEGRAAKGRQVAATLARLTAEHTWDGLAARLWARVQRYTGGTPAVAARPSS